MDDKSKQIDMRNWANLSRSVLNGVIGDYLEKEHNPLAIDMAFYHQNKALVLNDTLAQQLARPSAKSLTNKIIILIHGLTNLETVWDLKPEASDTDTNTQNKDSNNKDNYGRRLQGEFGYTPFYLRYNTGLSIKDNGHKLNQLLSELQSAYPIKIDDIVLMGFSMGGLLIRSAQKLAQDEKSPWLEKLSNCYYIGTPHEGSPLEKFGHLASSIVRFIPREYISHWADWIDMRSEGIQDLKDGLLHLKDDRSGASKETNEGDPYAQSVLCGSFTAHAQHHFISGALSENKDSLLNKYFGDSLVRHSSANPISAPQDSKTAHFDGIPHIPLAHSERVYQQLKTWFDEHQETAALVHYTLHEGLKTEGSQDQETNGLSNLEIISGTLDLLSLAYDNTVDAVEVVQHSIADEPFKILKKIPVVKEVSEPISVVHKDILDTIYFSLREGGKLAHKGAKFLNPSKTKR